ncbi:MULTISPECIES: TraI domain-containing protein [unclassified Serratia (in: enterobacteria)]|uniref:TraI domain-containing protein n=1 Tax=unclassified Serratia (in: enterobacteria) TaxID=2647522 RepID=UPI000468F161|nr:MULTISPECIES: TraI domain-containing protein [unclassified Serratia (in: enterobacteria)]
MLKSLMKYLPVPSVKTVNDEKAATTQSLSLHVPDGYHAPVSACELLAPLRRGQWLQMLWDYSSLPKNLYQQYYLQPLEHCVVLMQQFPATENDHHAYLGGMVDHLLETVAYAARLSKNYLLPVGAPPEEQASQSTAWNAVIVYAAMLQSLDRLCQIEVELESGQRWMPLNAMPGEPYRFRFKPVADAMLVQSLSAMLAWKVIPDEVLLWLGAWPEVLNTLSLYLTGFRNESGIVNAIVSEAISKSIGKPVSDIANIALTPVPPVSLDSVSSQSLQFASQFVEEALPESPVFTLDSAATVEKGIAPALLDEDVTGNLLAVMGLSEPTDLVLDEGTVSAQSVQSTETLAIKESENIPSPEADGIGEGFWQWLKEGCCSGKFSINTANSRIHIIAGYVFIRAPNIFHQFLAENHQSSADKTKLQSAFERLGRHRQDKGVMYTCHVYQDKAREGKFQKMTGYLIVAKKLYEDHHIPEDNPSMVVKS